MIWSLLACSFFEEPEPPPNIIIIIVDTLRADHVGVYGATNPVTPVLDQLAMEGQFFTRAYAHSGWTLPSTTSLFTGLYPHEHRVGRSPNTTEEFGSLPPEQTTLAELFQQKSYKTAAVINNTFLAPTFGLNQGFEEYFYQGSDNMVIRSAKESTDIALDWWKRTEGAKFLVIHYMEPHMNLNPPASTRGVFLKDATIPVPFAPEDAFEITKKIRSGEKPQADIAQVQTLYDEEIVYVDTELGRLTEELKEDEVIFAFTSDHGEEFWEQGGFEHGHHVGSLLTRVPLVIWGAGIEKKGAVESVVSHSDLFRSLLGLAGIVPPAQTHGIPIINQTAIPDQAVISENTLYKDPQLSIVNRDYRLEINQKTKTAALWKLDENGIEQQAIDENLQELATPLYEEIERVRGGIEPVEQVSGLVIPDYEVFLQLKKLGYLKE